MRFLFFLALQLDSTGTATALSSLSVDAAVSAVAAGCCDLSCLRSFASFFSSLAICCLSSSVAAERVQIQPFDARNYIQ